MNIGSVNYNLGTSFGAYNQKLTQATREKLIELGIPVKDNMTEKEGKALIKSESTRNARNEQNNLNNGSNSNSLFDRLKTLAQKLGVEIPNGANFESIIASLEKTLEEKISSSNNNVEMLQELKGLSQELASIQAQSIGYSGYNNTNQALMTSLELLAQYNKNYLNN